MQNKINIKKIFDIIFLYGGKSGGVIVGLFVVPLYYKLLGPDIFGVIAIILSVQSFLMMMDFGTSTIVSRDISASKNMMQSYLTIKSANIIISISYFVILIISLFINSIIKSTITEYTIFLSVILFWSLTVQNVALSALLATRRYVVSGITQVAGVLGRAAITLGALTWIESKVDIFLLAQASTAVVHMAASSWICRQAFNPNLLPVSMKMLRTLVLEIAERGRPLIVFGLAGAAVMQLDKLIIPIFVSAAALTPYYLASTLCITPISVLAGPINQYFFPSIIQSINNENSNHTLDLLKRQILAICLVVAIPSFILWFWREPIVNIWLHQQPIASDVVGYLEILLPALALGALGYVPYNIIIAHEDYRAHSVLSACMTVITLTATTLAAALGSMLAICWIYAGYHSLSVIFTWWRASYLTNKIKEDYVIKSLRFTFYVVLIILLFMYFIGNIIDNVF